MTKVKFISMLLTMVLLTTFSLFAAAPAMAGGWLIDFDDVPNGPFAGTEYGGVVFSWESGYKGIPQGNDIDVPLSTSSPPHGLALVRASDTSPYTLALRVCSSGDGFITNGAIRASFAPPRNYVGFTIGTDRASDSAPITIDAYNSSGIQIATRSAPNPPASGRPVPLAIGVPANYIAYVVIWSNDAIWIDDFEYESGNNPPVAEAGGPYVATENEPILFDASGSWDQDSDYLQYRWNFDGTWTGWSYSYTTDHTWCDNFEGPVTLEVRDGEGPSEGHVTSDTAMVTVTNLPPGIEELSADRYTVNVGETINFTGIAKDPGCDTLTAVWSGGDGLSQMDENLPPAYNQTISHQYNNPGVFPVTLTVTDDDGASDTRTISVTVAALPPPGCSTDLIAGQNIEAGKVNFWNDDEYVYVKYSTTGGWYLTETHLQIAGTLDGIPQTKKGNPIPGQFDYAAVHDPGVTEYVYKIPISDFFKGDVYIAAHAVVNRIVDGKVVQKETAWADGKDFPGKNWAMYFTCSIR